MEKTEKARINALARMVRVPRQCWYCNSPLTLSQNGSSPKCVQVGRYRLYILPSCIACFDRLTLEETRSLLDRVISPPGLEYMGGRARDRKLREIREIKLEVIRIKEGNGNEKLSTN